MDNRDNEPHTHYAQQLKRNQTLSRALLLCITQHASRLCIWKTPNLNFLGVTRILNLKKEEAGTGFSSWYLHCQENKKAESFPFIPYPIQMNLK